MRRYRRRKQRGLWLPVYGNQTNSALTDNAIGAKGVLSVDGTGQIFWDAFAVTFDYTESAYNAQAGNLGGLPTLRDIVDGNEWSLRRIVGKFFCGMGQTFTGDYTYQIPAVELAAGYLVCKTDEEGDATTDFDEVNPLVQESAEDPWIWRRKWILTLGKAGVTPVPGTGTAERYWFEAIQAVGLPSTANYNSVADGPHIDQKTNRRIHRQERLYFVLASRVWNPLSGTNVFDAAAPVDLWYNLDHRLFGSLGSTRGNRKNASR